MLQYCVPDFFAVPKLAGFRFGRPMQLGPDNLDEVGIELRLIGRPIQSFLLNAVAHILQGNPESLLRLRIVEKPNAEFFYLVPK